MTRGDNGKLIAAVSRRPLKKSRQADFICIIVMAMISLNVLKRIDSLND